MEKLIAPVGFKQKHIVLMVSLALPFVMQIPSAHAACTALSTITLSTANLPVSTLNCADGNNRYSNSVVINDTAAASNSNLATVSFEGLGNTLTNTGEINNNSTVTGISAARTRTAVVMGDYTVARNAFSAQGNGGGVNTIQLGASTPNLTPAQLIGKKIILAGAVVDGEARPGETGTITAYDPATKTATVLVDNSTGNWLVQPVAGKAYNIVAGSGTNIINNQLGAKITASLSASELTVSAVNTSSVKGISGNVAGDYIINNKGTIKASHAGVGGVIAVEGGGDVTTLTVNNSGTIAVERTGTLTLGAVSATALTATTSSNSSLAAGNVGGSGAINTQEELETFTLNNQKTGVIEAIGAFTPAIYMRAEEQIINNSGVIRNLSTNGFAIGSVSDSGEIRTLTLNNSGEIQGVILAVNGQAQRWHALSTLGTLDSRLNINSQWGQLDSTIQNSGSIRGNVYFSNGQHVLTNALGATLIGNIDVDHRDTRCAQANSTSAGCGTGGVGQNTVQTAVVETVTTAGSTTQTINVYNITATTPGTVKSNKDGLTLTSSATTTLSSNPTTSSTTYSGIYSVVGAKEFTFENAGSFTGNLTLRTASSSLLGDTVTSKITLIPTITGTGGETADTASATGVAGLGNNLNVISTAGGAISDVTIKPKVADGVTVVDGQYYKLANTFQINSSNVAAGATTLPTVEASNSLVSWTASVNNSNALVLESEVADASSVPGVRGNSANALNALVSANNPLLGTIANLEGDEKVAQAAESLVPEVNGASLNAAQRSFGSAMQLISNRNTAAQTNFIASSSGQRGVSTGDEPQLTGFWMQAIGYNADQNRRKGADGYDVAAYGAALGVDRIINLDNNLRVGGAFTYTNSKVEADGSNNGDRVSLNSYMGSLYASMNMGDWYLNGSVVAGQHQYDSRRMVVNGVASGDYDAQQYGVFMDAGMPINIRLGTLIPVVSAAYNYLNIDGYKERGTGALSVSSTDVQSFRTGLGARMLFPVYKNNSFVELRGVWFHEYADSRFDTTARFTTGGSSFRTNGVNQARDSANLGISVKLNGDANAWMQQSLLFTYDAEVKDQFLSHTGSVQLRFDF